MDIHEAANIFPLDEEHLGDLAAAIKAHGQQVPIELLDGKVIDGRRRLRACELAGVRPKTRTVETSDPIQAQAVMRDRNAVIKAQQTKRSKGKTDAA